MFIHDNMVLSINVKTKCGIKVIVWLYVLHDMHDVVVWNWWQWLWTLRNVHFIEKKIKATLEWKSC